MMDNNNNSSSKWRLQRRRRQNPKSSLRDLLSLLLVSVLAVRLLPLFHDDDSSNKTRRNVMTMTMTTMQESNDYKLAADDDSNSNSQEEEEEEEGSAAIFYNIFVPPSSDDNSDGSSSSSSTRTNTRIQNALDIVSEQLATKQKSSIARDIPIYYTMIGHNATNDIQRMCHDTDNDCRRLQYSQEGDESLTLQRLWEYCQTHPAPAHHLVTYVHNKGSYHPSEENTNLRSMLTKSVFSDECQSIASINNSDYNQCNTCGARFSPFPQWRMSGNMWVASCDYIQLLQEPKTFELKMEELINHFASSSSSNDNDDDTSSTLSQQQPKPSKYMIDKQWLVSKGRFALEHWIGSHPLMKPCDVYSNPEYVYGYQGLPDPSSTQDKWEPNLQVAPWIPLNKYFETFVNRRRQTAPGLQGSTSSSISSPKIYLLKVIGGDMTRNWLCGQARLLEFQYLYGHDIIPPRDSFFWTYYKQVSTQYCRDNIELENEDAKHKQYIEEESRSGHQTSSFQRIIMGLFYYNLNLGGGT